MKRLIPGLLLGIFVIGLASSGSLLAQRRRVVVRRGPIRRTTVVVRPGHPIHRVLPPVVLHPARRVVVVGAPVVFLPALTWRAAVVTLPPRERLAWQDSDTIGKDEEWVDCNFGVDQRGKALLLGIEGRAQLNFAEITFDNGNVQVVDFEEHPRESGIYNLLDFADGRHVKTVRVLARSNSEETTFNLYLQT